MKPAQETTEAEENENAMNGDAIGDTVYSERFVLKILLKFANLDTLRCEMQENSFEDDLCTLWDMTAERDVVKFLQKHNTLTLFSFALPIVESPRLIEIILGIIANMCCQPEVVASLLEMDDFLTYLLAYLTNEDSLVLVQILRLVNACLFLANDEHISVWIELFEKTEYSKLLYFILKNSSNKDLLVTALENFNAICTYCNIEKYKVNFFQQFVMPKALDSLAAAFVEVVVNNKESCNIDELERILVISLQIVCNLVRFDESVDVYKDDKEHVIVIINLVISYFKNKLVNEKEMDTDMVEIIESSNEIVKILQLSETCGPDNFFRTSYSIWRTLHLISKSEQNGSSSFEEDDKQELQEFVVKMQTPLSTLICIYMEGCSNDDFLQVLDEIGENYEIILSSIKDKEIKRNLTKRTTHYRTRLKDKVDA